MTLGLLASIGIEKGKPFAPDWAGCRLPVDQSARNKYGPARLQPTREEP
jgi:hypothetical protein